MYCKKEKRFSLFFSLSLFQNSLSIARSSPSPLLRLWRDGVSRRTPPVARARCCCRLTFVAAFFLASEVPTTALSKTLNWKILKVSSTPGKDKERHTPFLDARPLARDSPSIDERKREKKRAVVVLLLLLLRLSCCGCSSLLCSSLRRATTKRLWQRSSCVQICKYLSAHLWSNV